MIKIALVGSKFFAAAALEALLAEPGVQICSVVAPAADDRLALGAAKAGLPLYIQPNPKVVGPEGIEPGIDLIVAAYTHARISNEALALARLGGVGYHPSLLPRHRGIAAVEWTVLQGDPIAGGSIYHLADGWDAGAVAFQDWCFVERGETARQLWERALSPMGLALLVKTVRHARDHGIVPAHVQDTRYATKAPKIAAALSLAPEQAADKTTLVATVVGRERAGIIQELAQAALPFGANWATSHFASTAGEFAGMVQLDVPVAQANGLTAALMGLQTQGLQVTVVRSQVAPPPGGYRAMSLQLDGADREGIVHRLSSHLASRGVSIETLHTEIATHNDIGSPSFHTRARLWVPHGLDVEALRAELRQLAQELAVDVALA